MFILTSHSHSRAQNFPYLIDDLFSSFSSSVSGLVAALAENVHTEEFSLLEYGSKLGHSSAQIAQWFPQATIVSLEQKEELVHKHYSLLQEGGIKNNVVGRIDSYGETVSNLFASPEFFQYQVMNNVLEEWVSKASAVSNLRELLSKAISIGISSFFNLPSARVFSLAHHILYDKVELLESDIAQVVSSVDSYSSLFSSLQRSSFAAASHPSPPFQDIWKRFFQENLELPGLREISLRVLKNRLYPSQEIVQIRLRDMERLVNHHYRSEVDGHKRQYWLNQRGDDTYLIRTEDKSKIVYDTFGVSLITLVRLNLPDYVIDELYDQFIALPIYEDNAPWNIQYHAGVLQYVDKDSMDKTYDKFAPHMYQTILAFMNYERTLKDFGRCFGHQRVRYGVPFVGNCVQSSVDFECTDVEYPVPCADGKCHTSFLDCLKAVRVKEALEAQRAGQEDETRVPLEYQGRGQLPSSHEETERLKEKGKVRIVAG